MNNKKLGGGKKRIPTAYFRKLWRSCLIMSLLSSASELFEIGTLALNELQGEIGLTYTRCRKKIKKDHLHQRDTLKSLSLWLIC